MLKSRSGTPVCHHTKSIDRVLINNKQSGAQGKGHTHKHIECKKETEELDSIRSRCKANKSISRKVIEIRSSFMLSSKRHRVVHGISMIFVCDLFGVVWCWVVFILLCC